MITNERLKEIQNWATDYINRCYTGIEPESFIGVNAVDIDNIISELLTARQTIERLAEDGERLAEQLMWCGGSYDFSPEGKAHVGWMKGVRPALDLHTALMKEIGR